MKFSIIIPAYNIEKYIEKCIESILNQTYNNYEIIIINDGSTDNTLKKIKKYEKDNVIIIDQNNKGLSESRNIGVKKAKGDYILFVDGDDFVDNELLETLNNIIDNEDIIRFQIRTVDKLYNTIKEYNEIGFKNLNGIEAFERIVNYRYIEPAWCYAYKREYYKKNKYSFKKNMYHEDFGLVPLIIIESNKVSSINYIGYNYVQRENSIMNDNDYKKEIKKAQDVLEHYKYLILNNKNKSSVFNSFIANNVIKKSTFLKGKEYKKYIIELKQNKVFENLLTNSITRKIKKRIISISPKLYYKLFGGMK